MTKDRDNQPENTNFDLGSEHKLEVHNRPDSAAGTSGVTYALKHAIGKMGFSKTVKTLSKLNQPGGFDCPGCAWPDPDGHRSIAEFCENGAKAVADEAMKDLIPGDFFNKHTIDSLKNKSEYWLNKQGRLSIPLYKDKGTNSYKPITWDNALDLLASHLNRLDNPNQAAFYTSGRASNEAAFLYQLMVRGFGTNNLPDCSNLCHEPSGQGLKKVVGHGKGSVTLQDFSEAEAILIFGQNPGTNHPRMLSTLRDARKKGAYIIVVNPLPEIGSVRFSHPQTLPGLLGKSDPIGHEYLQVRVNGDVAFLAGLMKGLLDLDNKEVQCGIIDWQFIEDYTVGFEAFKNQLDSTKWSVIERESGLTQQQILRTAEQLKSRSRLIVCWAMGLTQQPNALQNIYNIINLLLLKGAMGKPGAGFCPVRGHSNVQGDRTMGIWEHPSEDLLQSLDKEFNFTAPREPGYSAVESIKAMDRGDVKVFMALGGNIVSAMSDTEFTMQALKKCELTVQISTKLNRSHVFGGKEALILPCLGRSEADLQASGLQFVTVENSMGIIHKSKGGNPPAHPELKSEPWILCQIAARLDRAKAIVDWPRLGDNYNKIREHIAHVIPGFSDFNKKIQEPYGFYLPHPVRDQLEFKTDTGKAHFTPSEMTKNSLNNDEMIMMTIRSHDQYNTTVYTNHDRYRGIHGDRRVVLIHSDDLKQRGFSNGDRVDIESDFNGEKRVVKNFVLVSYPIARHCIATYFPEANPLISINSVADGCDIPTSKFVRVRLRPHSH